jgi:hypothetical protein
MGWFDWRVVRGIGQLQLLNRASMFLVVFVPILAALWLQVQQSLRPPIDPAILLPESFALLFFASLAVLLARTMFQLGCPETVVNLSLVDYVRIKKREYSEAPSLNAVSEAVALLKKLGIASELLIQEEREQTSTEDEVASLRSRLMGVDGQIDVVSLKRLASSDQVDWDARFGSDLANLRSHSRDLRDQLRRSEEKDRGDRGPSFRRKMAIVETSARQSYIAEAHRSMPIMTICALLYATSIVLILKVIVGQASAVAASAGWL